MFHFYPKHGINKISTQPMAKIHAHTFKSSLAALPQAFIAEMTIGDQTMLVQLYGGPCGVSGRNEPYAANDLRNSLTLGHGTEDGDEEVASAQQVKPNPCVPFLFVCRRAQTPSHLSLSLGACERCKGLKVKCEFELDQNVCKRCHYARANCKISSRKKRRAQPYARHLPSMHDTDYYRFHSMIAYGSCYSPKFANKLRRSTCSWPSLKP